MEKIQVLSQKMLAESAILSDQVTVELLQAAINGGLASYKEVDGAIIAFGVLRVRGTLYEIGSLWTDIPYRKNGLTSKIFRDLLTKVPVDYSVFLVSNNPSIQNMCGEYMTEVTLKNIDTLGIPKCTNHDIHPKCRNFHCRFHHLENSRRMFLTKTQ